MYCTSVSKSGRLKLDSAGRSTESVAAIVNQVRMMLGHEIFDLEVSQRVRVDHAFIITGGMITKVARNRPSERLDVTKRNLAMFMDRDDIFNLFIVSNIPLARVGRASKM